MRSVVYSIQTAVFIWMLCVVQNICSARVRKPRESNAYEKDPGYWLEKGQRDIHDALNRQINNNVAKNVIFFLGDGMSISTIMASRVYKSQKRNNTLGEEGNLFFESFPNVGLLKTYNVDHQVPDSAGTSIAYLCGVKGNMQTIGVSAKVTVNDCEAVEGNRVYSVLKWAQEEGKSTGFVTTTRVSHATPAGLYAHTPNRNWESDSHVPKQHSRCKDITRQLVEDLPGRDIQVIMGGGRKHFFPKDFVDMGTGNSSGTRNDKRNLVDAWKKDKVSRGATYAYATNLKEFRSIKPDKVDYVLGLFSPDHMTYEVDRNKTDEGEPSLAEMTQLAIQILRKNPKGYFLLVEGGRIDHAHHENRAMRALEETVAMDDAVEATSNMVDLTETLVLVTADHSHVMAVNGYPRRGNSILGIAGVSPIDKLRYTTLMYTNGPGYTAQRTNMTQAQTADPNYQQLAAFPLVDETHSGEDVAVFATGPMSHLIYGVHEQSFVAHVMGYAACMGMNKDHCVHKHQHMVSAPFVARDTDSAVSLISSTSTGSIITSMSLIALNVLW